MLVIGVTGTFGSGKSAVCESWRQEGIDVISADEVARDVLTTQPRLIQALAQEFGQDIIDENGALDRIKLAEIVFNAPEKRGKLNEIMHPAIKAIIESQLEDLEDLQKPLVILEAPLLFETDFYKMVDITIAVIAPLEQIISRLEANGYSLEDITGRISAQLPQEEKAEKCDFVIENSGSLAELEEEAKLVMQSILRSIE